MDSKEYEIKTSDNNHKIKKQLSELAGICNDFVFDSKRFWSYVKLVNEAFKSLKPLKKEDRESLWREFQSLCEKAKEIQSRANRNFESNSREKREQIIAKIKFADLNSKINYPKSQNLLGEAMSEMKAAKMTKDDRNKCWELWKKIKEGLNYEKSQERKSNYNIVKEKISQMSNTAVYGEPKDALNEIKQIQSELKKYPMDDIYWQEVQSSLKLYWDKAQSRLDDYYREKQRNWEAKNREHEEKKQSWRRKQEGAQERFTDLISKNELYIDRLRNQIDDLRSQMYDGSASFKSRASGWVDEKLEKISDIQRTNSDLEYKIEDIRKQLND
jgi:hypothetical protein